MSAAPERTESLYPRRYGRGSPCVLFAGGGTGGHLMPALAAAHALKETAVNADCAFLASRRTLEAFRLPLRKFRTFEIPELRWLGAASALPLAVSSAVSLERTLEVFRLRRPDAVVGMGGWSCAPAMLAARMMRIPSLLMEANAVPGKTVRLLAPLSDAVQLQWETGAERLKTANPLPCGTPVHPALFEADRQSACRRYRLDPRRTTMLAMGGTQGALALNRLLIDAMKHLSAAETHLQILHITGPDHIGEFGRIKAPRGITYRPVGFERKMGHAYAAADFALCRAGGGTLAELSALALPAVLLPYPHAAENHQLANAKKLVETGGAILLEQKDLTAETLAGTLADLAKRSDLRMSMRDALKAAARPCAARDLAEAIVRLSERKPVLPQLRGRPENSTSCTLNSLLSMNNRTFNGGQGNGRSRISYGAV